MHTRLLPAALLLAACRAGAIDDPRAWVPLRGAVDPHAASAGGWGVDARATPQGRHEAATAGHSGLSEGTAASEAATGANAGSERGTPAAISGGAASAFDPDAVGSGDPDHPVLGPAPSDAALIEGDGFRLVKNWDFGTLDTLPDTDALSVEFQYHDALGSIASGDRFGAVIAAPDDAHAITAAGLNLPNDRQPVEDPARPYRTWTEHTLKAYVRPLSSSQSTVTVAAHDAGCGSFAAKWTLPHGGALLARDVLWETRVRMPAPLPGYWFALSSAGDRATLGAQVDVLEAFGAASLGAKAFRAHAIGGFDAIDYTNWPAALSAAGVPDDARDLTQWHIWTWLYLRDDEYQVFYDGQLVQHGAIHWTEKGTVKGAALDLRFNFDFGWGHTQIADIDISLPATMFPLVYEIDYSRVYLR